MKAFNFFWIDCIRCKMQLTLAFGLMVFFSIIFTSTDQAIGFITGYIFFLSVAFAGQPFNIETQSDSGFINMLPGTKRQRVTGRFLYAVTGIALAAIIVNGMIFMYKLRGMEIPENIWQGEAAMFGAALLIVAIELICLYAVGKGKSPQFITFIQMIPSFAMFFGIYGIIEFFESHQGMSLDWILEHKTPLAAAAVAVGAVAMLLSYIIANKITAKRDYA